MIEIATVTALLSGIKTSTDLARAIKDSGVSLEQAEMRLKLADLVSALADVRIQAADVRQTLLEAQDRIRELEAQAKLRAELAWRQPCYWRMADSGEEEPFCQPCQDNHSRLSRLHVVGDGHYVCRVCSQSFKSSERKARDKAEQDAAMRQDRFQGGRGGWMA